MGDLEQLVGNGEKWTGESGLRYMQWQERMQLELQDARAKRERDPLGLDTSLQLGIVKRGIDQTSVGYFAVEQAIAKAQPLIKGALEGQLVSPEPLVVPCLVWAMKGERPGAAVHSGLVVCAVWHRSAVPRLSAVTAILVPLR